MSLSVTSLLEKSMPKLDMVNGGDMAEDSSVAFVSPPPAPESMDDEVDDDDDDDNGGRAWPNEEVFAANSPLPLLPLAPPPLPKLLFRLRDEEFNSLDASNNLGLIF